MARGYFCVHGDAQTVATAITLLEVTAPATAMIEVMKAWIKQSNIVASTETRFRLLRKTATITGAASPPTAVGLDTTGSSGCTVKWLATAEGTDGNVIDEQSENYLNGYMWVPENPRKRLFVPPSGIIALKFPAAPTSASWSFGLEWDEIGN